MGFDFSTTPLSVIREFKEANRHNRKGYKFHRRRKLGFCVGCGEENSVVCLGLCRGCGFTFCRAQCMSKHNAANHPGTCTSCGVCKSRVENKEETHPEQVCFGNHCEKDNCVSRSKCYHCDTKCASCIIFKTSYFSHKICVECFLASPTCINCPTKRCCYDGVGSATGFGTATGVETTCHHCETYVCLSCRMYTCHSPYPWARACPPCSARMQLRCYTCRQVMHRECERHPWPEKLELLIPSHFCSQCDEEALRGLEDCPQDVIEIIAGFMPDLSSYPRCEKCKLKRLDHDPGGDRGGKLYSRFY